MINEQGDVSGIYRKSHIPDGPGYEEKYYFSPGDTGFQVWETPVGCIGVGICWDQWFPECARAMTLMGADLLLYPTAIGSEPDTAGNLDTSKMWRRAMLGHAVCNSVYVAAANRFGRERLPLHGDGFQTVPTPAPEHTYVEQTFYGHSFVSDYSGELLTSCDQQKEQILYADLDFKKARTFRAGMGFFRDRRKDLYGTLCKNGSNS